MNRITPESLSRYARRFKYWRETVLSVPLLCSFTLLFAGAAVLGEIALCRIGCAMIAASQAYTATRLFRFYWGMDKTADCLTHYRTMLSRRRDLLRGSRYWGSLPTGAGAILATVGWIYAEPHRWLDAAAAGIFGVGLQLALWAGNGRAAHQLQRELDRLELRRLPVIDSPVHPRPFG
jgi:hypothetical protein